MDGWVNVWIDDRWMDELDEHSWNLINGKAHMRTDAWLDEQIDA